MKESVRQFVIASSLFILAGMQVTPTAQELNLTSIRSDGYHSALLLNEEPLFLHGFYYTHKDDLSETCQIIDELVAAEFNAILTFDLYGSDTEAGFNYIADNHNGKIWLIPSAHPVNISPELAEKEAAFVWAVKDDADAHPPEDIEALHDEAKANDPYDRVTFISNTGWNQDRRDNAPIYTGITDISGVQVYPIERGEPKAPDEKALWLQYTYEVFAGYADASAGNNRPLIGTTQAYKAGNRYPTAQEERNMTYAAIAAGVKGIITLRYLKHEWTTEFWNEMKALRQDTKVLAPALLDGIYTRRSTGTDTTHCSTWEYSDTLYVVVINSSYYSSKSVDITLPHGYHGPCTSLFARMPSHLTSSGGHLTGTLNPEEVHVYYIAKGGSTQSDFSPFEVQGTTPEHSVNASLPVEYFTLDGRRVLPRSQAEAHRWTYPARAKSMMIFDHSAQGRIQ